jgi:CHAD domain-containing protein
LADKVQPRAGGPDIRKVRNNMTEHKQWTANMPLIEAVRTALLEQAGNAAVQFQRACSEDMAEATEGIHDARVALRRSIALLTLAKPWIDKKWVAARRSADQSFLRLLGSVRDADVLVLKAGRFFAGQEAVDAGALLAQLRRRRDRKHAALCRRLGSKDSLQKLGREMAALSVADAAVRMLPVPVSDRGSVRLYRLADCLPVMLWRAASVLTVFHSVVNVQAQAPDGQADISELVLHRLRLAAKDFRYVVSFAGPLLGQAADAMLQEFKPFQDVLGDWHDTVIARRLLEKMKVSPETEEAVRLWLAEQQAEGDSLQREFFRLWSRLTPQWFHAALSDGLTHFYAQSGETECQCCGGCGDPS